ncbi:Na(+) H(+) antiporter subunit C [Cystobacter fuscus]|uniref:Na(+) H(+) antiporter subunit C n=1 Tax=Cystobacter fuscus TaxID=43 RepID=A0A250JLJ9_9BACT|nr:sodium:proton antiporter [Cystobacter fuscus]ATB44342.1 Na(+) H(+) antiporter subunit C [Cystobacter fuscus]
MNAAVALTVGLLFGVGVLLTLKRDLVRMAAGGLLLTNSAILFILSTGFPERGEPLHDEGATRVVMTDPLAQALALTAIVIGFATSALLLAFVYRMHEQHGSLDLRDVVHAELEEEQSLTREPSEPEER